MQVGVSFSTFVSESKRGIKCWFFNKCQYLLNWSHDVQSPDLSGCKRRNYLLFSAFCCICEFQVPKLTYLKYISPAPQYANCILSSPSHRFLCLLWTYSLDGECDRLLQCCLKFATWTISKTNVVTNSALCAI